MARKVPSGTSKLVKAIASKIDLGGKAPTVKPWEVGQYGPMKARPGRGGMDMDHIPSKAALLKRAEARKGKPLTKAEADKVINEGSAMAVPRKSHQQKSRTYGGRNNKDQVAHDANNPAKATELDFNRYRQDMKDQGFSDKAIEDALARLRAQNKGIK
ncbi:hypothetical protein ACQB6R_01530 [Propionibacteriaceae bacterium G1746]|uniref:hypothetical protein n=1 Tax=Aestuariimicrobium sp. G57 TaxID=3418485 RepID=UPI003C26A6A7